MGGEYGETGKDEARKQRRLDEPRKRDKCRHGGVGKGKAGRVQLTSPPDPPDGLMDVQKALILFSGGLAATPGPSGINTQSGGRMAATSPLLPWCHFLLK